MQPCKFFLTIIALCSTISLAHAELKVGDSFPNFSNYKLEGAVPDTKSKVVLVDFWASWCGPCKQSFPALEELQKKYGPQGFVVIAISVDEKKSDMEDFLKEHPVSFATVRDSAQKLVEKTEVSAMPSSFLVDAAGKVRFVHTGYYGNKTKQEYTHEIETLLKK